MKYFKSTLDWLVSVHELKPAESRRFDEASALARHARGLGELVDVRDVMQRVVVFLM